MNSLKKIEVGFNQPVQYGNPKLKPTIINAGTKFDGNITSDSCVIIEGTLIGNINAESVIIGRHAICAGNIKSDSLVVIGRIDGKIKTKHIEIRSSGSVFGNIQKETISVGFGAILEAKIKKLK